MSKIFLKATICLLGISCCIFTSCHSVDPQNPRSYFGKFLKLDSETASVCKGKQTVLAFFDLRECLTCQIKELSLWTDFLTVVKSSSEGKDNPNVVFVLNVPMDNHISESVEDILECYPVKFVFDSDDLFRTNNVLPQLSQYHCFLLDRRGRIELVGIPNFNSSLFDKYLDKLTSEKV